MEGIVRILDRPASPNPNWDGANPDPGTSTAPYRIYNIGNHQPVALSYFVECLENCIGSKAIKNMLPMQPGDVLSTFADVEDLARDYDFRPKTSIEEGVRKFVEWYRSFYHMRAGTSRRI